ncbi:restriction endonuclease subunit S [Streptomyces sp. NPDC050856]|uniref:restriction endonuclease subunit S n=1 Tax=Streptomyces sp. NPDC050856 TaxID=3154939 RepID=UPI0033E2D95F
MQSDARTDWPLRRLTDLVSLPVGQVDPRMEPYRNRVLLAPDHIEPRTGKIIKRESAADQGASSGKYVVQPGDVIFSKIRPALRKVALADFSGTCSADTYPLRPGEEITSGFLMVVLLSEHFSRYVESLSGRTGIPKVNRVDLAGYFFRLPPLQEQRRIVEVIDAVSAQERAIEASIAKLQVAREAAAEQYLGAVGREILLEKSLVSLEVGVASVGPEAIPAAGEWGVIRLGAVTSGKFDSTQTKRLPDGIKARPEYEIRNEDILMVRVNGSVDLVGSVCVAENVPPRLMLSDLVFRLKPKADVFTARYLSEVLTAPLVRRRIVGRFRGTSGQFQLPKSELRTLPVPSPGLEVQREICRVLDGFDVVIAREAVELVKTGRMKQALVDRMLVRDGVTAQS